MNHRVVVSVVIPTFNRAGLIGETLSSVLSQTFQDLEVLVVDDGSVDRTAEVVAGFRDKRVRYTWRENSGRPAVARNIGIGLSRGTYVALLDSDDLWMPEKLERQLSAFTEFPRAWVVATNYRFFPDGKYTHLDCDSDLWPTSHQIAMNNPIGASSVLMKREIFEKAGTFDESPEVIAIEDYDYWLRVSEMMPGSILILREPLMLYRTHSTNLSHADEDVRLARKHLYVLAKFPNSDFRAMLATRLKRDIRVAQYDNLAQGKITAGDFLKDSSMSPMIRVTRFARFLASRMARRVHR
jgi:glycosyltransferase involved in cell wall biosynthesis